ncbi:hypothetical protein PMAYCL1PPCAC_16967, partial [Pristionchus mayeri]
ISKLAVIMPARLGDFSDPERLRGLIEFLTDGGRLNDRFENFVLHNVSTWILAGKFPKRNVRIFGYPATEPYYVFLVEESKYQFPHLQVRTPSGGHNRALLKAGLSAIIDKMNPDLEKHGQLLLEVDTTVRAMFLELQSEGAAFETVYAHGKFIPFFIDKEQKKKLLEMEFTAPEGFKIDTIDVPNEYELIYSMWPFRALSTPEPLRTRLEELPSSCVRAEDGSLVAWDTITTFGQLTHLFTLEPYRDKGLGVLAGNILSQVLARNGLHVYKYIVDTNVDVVRGTMKHPLWSRWRSVKNGKEPDEDNEDILWSFNLFKYIRAKDN